MQQEKEAKRDKEDRDSVKAGKGSPKRKDVKDISRSTFMVTSTPHLDETQRSIDGFTKQARWTSEAHSNDQNLAGVGTAQIHRHRVLGSSCPIREQLELEAERRSAEQSDIANRDFRFGSVPADATTIETYRIIVFVAQELHHQTELEPHHQQESIQLQVSASEPVLYDFLP